MPEERNPGLDGIRFLAEAMVFTCHLALYAPLAGALYVLVGLRDGVVLFFVLSGYLLYRPFVDGRVDLGSYAVRRAARILPAYFLALIGTTIVTGDDTFLRQPLLYLLFLQNYSHDPRIWQGFLGVSWTLVLEVLFYTSLPLLAVAVQRSPRRIAGLGALSLACAIVVFIAAWFSPYKVDPTWPSSFYPFMIWAFTPGMLLAVHRPRFLARSTTPLLGLVLLEASMVIGVLPSRFWWASIDFVAATGSYLLIGWAVVARPQRFARFCGAGAAISYSAYLWHVPVIKATHSLVPAVAATIAVASLSYLLVERPVLAWARARLRDRRRRREAFATTAALPVVSDPAT